MSKSPRCLDADCSDRSVAADVLLRQEPDEEEDEDEDEGDRKEDDEDEDTDNGYSERAPSYLCQWVKNGTRRIRQRC
jgi:hypothetical protein